MTSLFDAEGSAAFVARIRSIAPNAQAQWGKLDAPGALAHCRAAMAVALGEVPLKRSLIGLLLGGLVRKSIVDSPKPFRQDQPTDPRLIIADPAALGEEQARLVESVERFTSLGPAGMPAGPHPFFGKLAPEQWDRLMVKHLDHHLRQFGA